MNKSIICFDFETSHTDPHLCDIHQLAALCIDPVSLEVVPNSIFNSFSQPDDLNKPGYYEKFKSTIDCHCGNYKCTVDQYLDKLRQAPPEKIVWGQFIEYLRQYHDDGASSKTVFTAPIPAGANIINFDLIIIKRLCEKYKAITKPKEIFFNRDVRDITNICSLWLGPLGLKSFSMDNLREYFGIPKEGSHDALKDIMDEAAILRKFLKLHRTLAEKIQFKDSFNV